jgi:hypothetical protein
LTLLLFEKPSFGVFPEKISGAWRNAEHLSRLIAGQTRKKPEFY